jgi:hypothetical protein
MSGVYQDWNSQPGVPGGRAESEAAVRQGIAEAMSAFTVTQGEADRFMRENGADSVAHEAVGRPGRQGDPDVSSDASDG